jgi:hypothetical protein
MQTYPYSRNTFSKSPSSNFFYCQSLEFYSKELFYSQGARIYVFGMITIGIAEKAFHDITFRILNHSREMPYLSLPEYSRLHLLHSKLTIILHLSESFVGTALFIMFNAGFFVSVGCTFIAFRLYSTLPFLLYGLNLAMLMIVPAAINIIFTQVIRTFENGSEILAVWKLKPASKKRVVSKLRTKS